MRNVACICTKRIAHRTYTHARVMASRVLVPSLASLRWEISLLGLCVLRHDRVLALLPNQNPQHTVEHIAFYRRAPSSITMPCVCVCVYVAVYARWSCRLAGICERRWQKKRYILPSVRVRHGGHPSRGESLPKFNEINRS